MDQDRARFLRKVHLSDRTKKLLKKAYLTGLAVSAPLAIFLSFLWSEPDLPKVNLAVSTIILATYPLVLYMPSLSLIAELGEELRREEAWRKSDDNTEELRMVARSLVPTSGTLAAIGLATIAFAVRSPEFAKDINVTVGVAMMLSSSVLFFWSLGMNFAASVPTRSKYELNWAAFEHGYGIISLGIYLYFLGLLWALSVLNLWFTRMAALSYFIIFSALVITHWAFLRRRKQRKAKEERGKDSSTG